MPEANPETLIVGGATLFYPPLKGNTFNYARTLDRGNPNRIEDREKLRFELIKTIDNYDACFTERSMSLPEENNETLRKQIYDIAHQEHDRNMHMLKGIMRLKIKVLVAEYQQQNNTVCTERPGVMPGGFGGARINNAKDNRL